MGKVGDTMTYKSITVGFRICPVCKFYAKPFLQKQAIFQIYPENLRILLSIFVESSNRCCLCK